MAHVAGVPSLADPHLQQQVSTRLDLFYGRNVTDTFGNVLRVSGQTDRFVVGAFIETVRNKSADSPVAGFANWTHVYTIKGIWSFYFTGFTFRARCLIFQL